jgi:hypothetical protein
MADRGDALGRWHERRVPLDCGPLKGRQFDITYEGSSGELSGRRVRVEAMSHVDGTYYLEAFCHLRREQRTFAIHGICQVVDPETGEVFHDGEQWLESVGLWVRDGEPSISRLGRDADGSQQFEVQLNIPPPVKGDRPAQANQRASLQAAFGMTGAEPLGERQAAALLAWWDYAGALAQMTTWEGGKGAFSDPHFRLLITAVISTLPQAAADIALWSTRRCHQSINPATIPKMSHYEEIAKATQCALHRVAEMRR